VIRIFNCSDADTAEKLLARGEVTPIDVSDTVAAILRDVRERGDAAVREYTLKFDGADINALEVTADELKAAVDGADAEFLAVLREARDNIEAYHIKQKRTGFWIADKPGIILGQKLTALDRAGVYVPGGTASYASTVLMDVVPAKIAGVGEIIMITPPGKNGMVNPDILAAASIAGVDRVFKAGGAQAIAALAYGTQSIPRVDKIVGPGNVYVATAKRMVYGIVDIDMVAGPSEILIIADETANPAYVAADMLSQAEHDPLAAAFLITTSAKLADEAAKQLEIRLAALPRREMAEQAIRDNSAIIIADTLPDAVEISNRIAPEHLEIMTQDPWAMLPLVRHAGSIFLGKYAPEALGDYFAGTNHTLPTSGTARFSSGLSVDDFIKKSSVIYYDKSALAAAADKIALFARREGLEAHARSVTIRMEDKDGE
jgi:histidinol dehydrogenase